jgi:hypothetical protein
MEEWLASTEAKEYGDQGEVAHDRLGLADGHRSRFEKFDLETLTVQNTVEGGGQ